MNTKSKPTNAFSNCRFLTAACGQGKKKKSLHKQSLVAQQRKRQHAQATTIVHQTTKAAQSDANEVKTVYQLVNTNVTNKN